MQRLGRRCRRLRLSHCAELDQDFNQDDDNTERIGLRSEREALMHLVAVTEMPSEVKRQLDRVKNQWAHINGSCLTLGVWKEAFPDFPVDISVEPAVRVKELASLSRLYASTALVNKHFAREEANGFSDIGTVLMVKLPYADWAVVHKSAIPEHVTAVGMPQKNGVLVIESTVSYFARHREVLAEYFKSISG